MATSYGTAGASSGERGDAGVALSVRRYSSRSARPLAPQGSIVVYLAAAGSRQLAELQESTGAGSRSGLLPALASVIRGILQLFGIGEGKHVDLEAMDRAGGPDPVAVSLHYAGSLLAGDVPVPRDGRVVRLILPYTGGELVEGGLVLRGENASSAVSSLVLRHDPPLTRVERAALELVPEAMLGLHVGAALPGNLLGKNDEERRRQQEERRRQDDAAREARNEQAVARAEAQAEMAAERAERRAEKGRDFEPHLSEAIVRELPPFATAAALLQMRRDTLAVPGM